MLYSFIFSESSQKKKAIHQFELCEDCRRKKKCLQKLSHANSEKNPILNDGYILIYSIVEIRVKLLHLHLQFERLNYIGGYTKAIMEKIQLNFCWGIHKLWAKAL